MGDFLGLMQVNLTRYTMTPMIMGLVALGLGMVVLIRERFSRIGLSFWVFSLTVGLWLVTLATSASMAHEAIAIGWLKVSSVGATFIPSTICLFTLAIVDRLRQYRLFVWLSVFLSAAFCAGSLATDGFVQGVTLVEDGYYPLYGPLNTVFQLYLFAMIVLCFRLYWVEYQRASSGVYRRRLGGFIPALGVAGYLGYFDYFLAQDAPVYPFSYLPIFAFFVMAARALKHYRAADLTPSFAADQIIETINDALIVCDVRHMMHFVNARLCELLEYEECDLLTQPIERLVERAPSSREAFRVLLLANEQLQDQELVFYTKRGEPIQVSVSLARLFNSEHVVVGSVIIARDIRERKRAEEQQRLANLRLEKLAALKDEFVAKMSHEVRTPLTSIKEGISLMLDEALGSINAEQRDFLRTVDENIDRLTELITNMLDISKIEAGRLRLARRRVAAHPLIDTAINSYRAMAGGRTLQTFIEPTPEVFADPNRILQVLGNLISNAIKFTRNTGTIIITVGEHDGAVRISVRDDGVGIAPDDLSKLFKRFSQVGNHDGQPSGGTGLGLALCKELVELHRGTIAATSEVGKGTAFTFTLPVYTQQFAVQDSFVELVEIAARTQQESVGVIAIDASSLLGPPHLTRAEQRQWHMEQILELVHKYVHRDDAVLSLDPQWIIVLAMTDLAGVRAMVQRLRATLEEWTQTIIGMEGREQAAFGVALYPRDGDDIELLLKKATGSLNRGLASVEAVGGVS